MRRSFLILALFLWITSIAITAKAHPGETDAAGGHIDRATGEYHYHHGYAAHGHYDMDGDGDIDCPYNFHDQTGINSGTSSNNSHSSYSYTDEDYDNIVTKTVTKKVPYVPSWVYWVIGIGSIISIIMFVIIRWKNKEIQHWEDRYRAANDEHTKVVSEYEDSVAEIKQTCSAKIQQNRIFYQNRTDTLTEEIKALESANSSLKEKLITQDGRIRMIFSIWDSQVPDSRSDEIRSLLEDIYNSSLNIPNNVYFLEDSTPVIGSINPTRPYGDLTVYISKTGNCYHKDFFCSGAHTPVYAYKIIDKIPPCKKCAAECHSEIPDWYIRLKKVNKNDRKS